MEYLNIVFDFIVSISNIFTFYLQLYNLQDDQKKLKISFTPIIYRTKKIWSSKQALNQNTFYKYASFGSEAMSLLSHNYWKKKIEKGTFSIQSQSSILLSVSDMMNIQKTTNSNMRQLAVY